MAEISEIIIGSTSAHKLTPTFTARDRVFPAGSVPGVSARDVETGVNAMPDGDAQTSMGAINRAYNARKALIREARYRTSMLFLGIEGGVRTVSYDLPDGGVRRRAFAMGYVVGLFGQTSETIIIPTVGIEFPIEIYDEARSRGFETTTIGTIVAERCGGHHTDPYTPLTNGVISRIDTFVDALTMLFRLVLAH